MLKVFVVAICFLVISCDAKPYRGSGVAESAAFRPARQAAAEEPRPEPYSFSYETTDEYGMTLTRTETGDENGNVKGSYMYRDPQGVYRTVEYGDVGGGFTAQIQTNEPGVVSHKAADAEYFKN